MRSASSRQESREHARPVHHGVEQRIGGARGEALGPERAHGAERDPVAGGGEPPERRRRRRPRCGSSPPPARPTAPPPPAAARARRRGSTRRGRRARPARPGPCWTAARPLALVARWGPCREASRRGSSAHLSRPHPFPTTSRCPSALPLGPRHCSAAGRPRPPTVLSGRPHRRADRSRRPALPARRRRGRRWSGSVPAERRLCGWAWAVLRASGCAFGLRAQTSGGIVFGGEVAVGGARQLRRDRSQRGDRGGGGRPLRGGHRVVARPPRGQYGIAARHPGAVAQPVCGEQALGVDPEPRESGRGGAQIVDPHGEPRHPEHAASVLAGSVHRGRTAPPHSIGRAIHSPTQAVGDAAIGAPTRRRRCPSLRPGALVLPVRPERRARRHPVPTLRR